MDASPHAQIEQLTDELRQLVGRGVNPMRLVTLPTLRSVSRVDDSKLTARQTGFLIRRHIETSILELSDAEPYAVWGTKVEAAVLRRCLRLLLKYEGTGQDATNRRERVLYVTQINFPLGQMRRPNSPEREMLGILAQRMVLGC